MDCRAVRRATGRIRSLRLAPGPAPSASASGGYGHTRRVRTQCAVFPSAKARAPLVADGVDEPAAHIRAAAAAEHPTEADYDDLPEDVCALRTPCRTSLRKGQRSDASGAGY